MEKRIDREMEAGGRDSGKDNRNYYVIVYYRIFSPAFNPKHSTGFA